jgi:hypothetical protein
MRTQRIIGCLLIVVATVMNFAQFYALFTAPQPPPILADFQHDYLVKSSIEQFGFGILAIVIGFLMLRSRARYSLWFALIIAGAGLWQFVIREVWLHYYYMPHKYPHYAERDPTYFSGPLWWELVRLSWHIALPTAFILAVILLLRRTSDNSPETI